MKAELDSVWAKYRALLAEADEIRTNVKRIQALSSRHWFERYRRTTEARNFWRLTVRRVCGEDATIEWVDGGCIVIGIMEFNYKENKNG